MLCTIFGGIYMQISTQEGLVFPFSPLPSAILLTIIQQTGKVHMEVNKSCLLFRQTEWSKSDTDPQCAAAAAQGHLTSRCRREKNVEWCQTSAWPPIFNNLQACLCSGAQPVRGVSSWVMWWGSSARKLPSCAVLATRRAASPPDTMLTWSYGTQTDNLKLVLHPQIWDQSLDLPQQQIRSRLISDSLCCSYFNMKPPWFVTLYCWISSFKTRQMG